MSLEIFFIELSNNPSAKGYIINYGSLKDVANRKFNIEKFIMLSNFDFSRISIHNGGFKKEIETELWIVPANAENPKPEPTAIKFDEFEKATNGYIKMNMDAYLVELNNNPTGQGYAVNYGTSKEIARREKQIMDGVRFRKFDPSRITFVNGGFRGIVKTEFWIVPPGAEPPTP